VHRQTFCFQNIGKFADLFEEFTVGDLTAVIRVITFPVNHAPLPYGTHLNVSGLFNNNHAQQATSLTRNNKT